MRRAKIVATLGPATDDLATVQKLIKAGLNVARLNMSHGDHADHKKRLGLDLICHTVITPIIRKDLV